MNTNDKTLRKKEIIDSIKLALQVALVLSYAIGHLIYAYEKGGFEGMVGVNKRILSLQLWYPLTSKMIIPFIGIWGIVFPLAIYGYSVTKKQRRTYDKNTAKGSAHFMTQEEKDEYNKLYLTKTMEEIEVYRKKYIMPCDEGITRGDEAIDLTDFDTIILSESFRRYIGKNSKHDRTNNVLLIGDSGSGKSFRYFKPNIAQCNSSILATDPSTELFVESAQMLINHGYTVRVFNTEDMKFSNSYNPFAYLRADDESSVLSMVQCFMDNTNPEGGSGGENGAFFDKAERLLYSAIIFALKEFCKDSELQNFHSVLSAILSFSNSENAGRQTESSPLEDYLKSLPETSLARQNYNAYTKAPGRTRMSIVISALVRLQPFMINEVKNITSHDELELDQFGFKKMALFLIPSSANKTFNWLNAMIFTQFYETNFHYGNKRQEQTGSTALPIPVHCMIDEANNVGIIPDLAGRLSDQRKYNIFTTIAIQDLSQISEDKYEKTWRNIVANCTTRLFLGGSEIESLEVICKMLGEATIRVSSDTLDNKGTPGGKNSSQYSTESRELVTVNELSQLDKNECIIITAGLPPVRDRKASLLEHPRFSQMGGRQHPELNLKFRTMPIYDSSKRKHIVSYERAKRLYSQLEDENGSAKVMDIYELDRNKSTYEESSNLSDKNAEEDALDTWTNKIFDHAAMNIYGNGMQSIVFVENIPADRLAKLAENVHTSFGFTSFIIFTYIKGNGDRLDEKALGIVIDESEKKDALKMLQKGGDMSKYVIDFPVQRSTDPVYEFTVAKNVVEEFIEKVKAA